MDGMDTPNDYEMNLML